MAVEKSFFGNIEENTPIYLYKITNSSGASVTLQTLGAGIQSLCVPDRNGVLADVVLGFDNPQDYLNPDYGYQGLVVGRWANRIRDGHFVFDGKAYNTPKNQGTWTLHGGGRFSFTPWDVEETGEDYIVFKRFSPDGEDGFAGNFTMKVKYTLTDDNILRIAYTVLCDIDTVANPTNHAYFNFTEGRDNALSHELYINADRVTVTGEGLLPVRDEPVSGGKYDFRTPRRIAEPIYDNNFILNKNGPDASLYEESSGIYMELTTDRPCLQLYASTMLREQTGRYGCKYGRGHGVCLEPQLPPDCPNIKGYERHIITPENPFKARLTYRFSVR